MFIEATNENGRRFLERGITGSLTMLNLLRFRAEADYSAHPELAPDEPITGREAYDRYAHHTLPFLSAVGGDGRVHRHRRLPPHRARRRTLGPGDAGPACQRRGIHGDGHQRARTSLVVGHRMAALEDSRLLPIVDRGTLTA